MQIKKEGYEMIAEYKVEEKKIDILECDGKEVFAIQVKGEYYDVHSERAYRGICKSCDDATMAWLTSYEIHTNVDDENDIICVLKYKCEECGEAHGEEPIAVN
jgi:hypothetical protein